MDEPLDSQRDALLASGHCTAQLDHHKPYVYYLCLGGEIVYVGRTENVMTRMSHHSIGKNRKPFDTALFHQCSSFEDMLALEAHEIDRLTPRYNRRHGRWPARSEDERLENAASTAYALAELIGGLDTGQTSGGT